VGEKMGIAKTTLLVNFPDKYKEISQRYKDYKSFDSQDRKNRLELEMEQLVVNLLDKGL
jgi:hypothetical protein